MEIECCSSEVAAPVKLGVLYSASNGKYIYKPEGLAPRWIDDDFCARRLLTLEECVTFFPAKEDQ